MKTLVRIFLSVLVLCGSVVYAEVPNITGQWQYDGFIYEGKTYPLPNPDLVLVFTFYDDGLTWLYWYRKNETGFCERLANYSVNQEGLKQKVIWVNPLNDQRCTQDPDMTAGLETITPFSVVDGVMRLHLDLNGQPLLYLLKPLSKDP